MEQSAREWMLTQKGFTASQERERETLFSFGNGYCGLRGACSLPIPSSQSDLYIAGVYDAKAESLPYSETQFLAGADRDEPFPELVSFPSPFLLSIKVNKRELTAASTEMTWFERELDLRKSALTERYVFRDASHHQTAIRTVRCASLADPHVLFHEVEFSCTGQSQDVEVDTAPIDPDFMLRYPHLKPLGAGVFETKKSNIRICVTSRSAVDGEERGSHFTLHVEPDRPIKLQRFVTIYTSRDAADPIGAARSHIGSLRWEQFPEYLIEHERLWDRFWMISDIQIENNAVTTQMLRFNSYHLRIAAPTDGRASIGARTLSGRAYEGHIFWDAEVFVLPFLLYSHPELARNVLSYRYHTIDGARERARRLGCEGACFAWESTASGLDATPKMIRLEGTDSNVPIFTGAQQMHITGSVSHGVLQYWHATGDDNWMLDHGAEILFETARFWLSRAKYRSGKFHVEKVVGPDEYHHSVDDNTYTNWLVRYNLVGALDVAEWLRRTNRGAWADLTKKLNLKSSELKDWKHMAQHVFIPAPNSKGIFPQFEGFFDLKDVPLKSDEKYRAPFERLLKWDQVNSAKILKQADFLMTPFLFPGDFSPEQVRANFFYYEKITDHGSSLSPCVHSAIAARIGEDEFVRKYWDAGLKLDLHNLMKNTALGFHAACAAGTWQALVFHILGLPSTESWEHLPEVVERDFPIPGDTIRLKLMRGGKIFSYTVGRSIGGRKAA